MDPATKMHALGYLMLIAGSIFAVIGFICTIAVWFGLESEDDSWLPFNTFRYFYLRALTDYNHPAKWPILIGMYLFIPSVICAITGWSKM